MGQSIAEVHRALRMGAADPDQQQVAAEFVATLLAEQKTADAGDGEALSLARYQSLTQEHHALERRCALLEAAAEKAEHDMQQALDEAARVAFTQAAGLVESMGASNQLDELPTLLRSLAHSGRGYTAGTGLP